MNYFRFFEFNQEELPVTITQIPTKQPRQPLKAQPRPDTDRSRVLAAINSRYEQSLRRLGL